MPPLSSRARLTAWLLSLVASVGAFASVVSPQKAVDHVKPLAPSSVFPGHDEPPVDADDGLVYLPLPSHTVEVLCVVVYLTLATVAAWRALSTTATPPSHRRHTFQRLMVLFAVTRAASFVTGGAARNLLNRAALCLFFSLVLFQVLFWVDIANPQVSVRSRRIWIAFVLANGVFYAMVLGMSLVHAGEMVEAAEDHTSLPPQILWTGVLPVLLIALGSFVSSVLLLYSTWAMRRRVERVLKMATEGTRRRIDEHVEKKLTRALRFILIVMSVCSALFLLRTIIYIQRPFSHQGCGDIHDPDICIAFGYLLPEVVPCALFVILMWEVEPNLRLPPRRSLSFNSALAPSETTPLLFDEMMLQQIQVKAAHGTVATNAVSMNYRSLSSSSSSIVHHRDDVDIMNDNHRSSPQSLELGGGVPGETTRQFEPVIPQHLTPSVPNTVCGDGDQDGVVTRGASVSDKHSHQILPEHQSTHAHASSSTASSSFSWVSFQCFKLKFPSASPSSSFIVVHVLDPDTGSVFGEIGRTEVSTSEDPCFHLMIPVEMREDVILRVTVYSVRHFKSVDDLDNQWMIGDALVPLSTFFQDSELVCGHASLHSLYSPLSRSRSSGEIVVRCEAVVAGSDGISDSELERITRAFIYYAVENRGQSDDEDIASGEHSELAQQMIQLVASSQQLQRKLLVEEELIESVYTWEVPFQLLQLVLSDLMRKLAALKQMNGIDDPGVTATPSSQPSSPSAKPPINPPSSNVLPSETDATDFGREPDKAVAAAASIDNEAAPTNRMRSAPSIGMFSEMIMQIQDDAMERRQRKWRLELIKTMEQYISEVEDAIHRYGSTQHEGLTFKPSTMKADRDLRYLALNLHQQLMTVGDAVPTSESDVEYDPEASGVRYARLVNSFVGTILASPLQLSRRSSMHDKRGDVDDLHTINDEYDLEDESDADGTEATDAVDDTSPGGEHSPLEPSEALRRRVISFDSAEHIVNMSVNGENAGVSSEQRKLAETIVAMGRSHPRMDQASLLARAGYSVSSPVDTVPGLAMAAKSNIEADIADVPDMTLQSDDLTGNLSSRRCPFRRYRLYGTVTVGAFAAHAYGFKNGGLRHMREELERLHGRLVKESESSSSHLTIDALERQYNELVWDVERRLDVVFSQAVSALVTCFQQTLYVHSHDNVALGRHALRAQGVDYLEMISELGFLFSVESLLSTYSNEIGMLGDTEGAVRELARVQIKLRPVETPRAAAFRVSITCGSTGFVIEVPIITCSPSSFPDRSMHRVPGQDAATGAVYLPLSSANEKARAKKVFCKPISIVPVIFTQGMNEMQTVANTVGKNSLQREINAENVGKMVDYVDRFVNWCERKNATSHDSSLPVFDAEDISRLQQSLIALKLNIHLSGRSKRMEILALSSSIARLVGGGRVTCCKSAKDRTSMSITLEEAKLLVLSHGLLPEDVDKFTDLLRAYGVRRENARKNIGKAQYCFSALQNYMLPLDYQCPPGTGGGSRSFS